MQRWLIYILILQLASGNTLLIECLKLPSYFNLLEQDAHVHVCQHQHSHQEDEEENQPFGHCSSKHCIHTQIFPMLVALMQRFGIDVASPSRFLSSILLESNLNASNLDLPKSPSLEKVWRPPVA